MDKIIRYLVEPIRKIEGTFFVPGDKSVSHRTIMFGSIAEGKTKVTGFLAGEDCLATLKAFQDLGVKIEGPDNNHVVIIHGVGMHGLQAANHALDLGNSGTSIRLMTGILAGQNFASELTGDDSLRRRPMNRVIDPLLQMGAKIDSQPGGLAPLKIHPVGHLNGIEYHLPIASAQVKSCLMLAGLYAKGETIIDETVGPSRDHTERMMRQFGLDIKHIGHKIKMASPKRLIAQDIDVPGDISSAAFFIIAAAMSKDSDIVVERVGINPTRLGVINILRLMGAEIDIFNESFTQEEPIADIRVKGRQLHGIDIPREQVPLAIDEFPALFIAAASARGQTILRGAKELRVKESDRIASMAEGLQRLGIQAIPTPDGMIIEGGEMSGGTIDSCGDHRVAMSFPMASLIAKGPIEVENCAPIATSFPDFPKLAQQLGFLIQIN